MIVRPNRSGKRVMWLSRGTVVQTGYKPVQWPGYREHAKHVFRSALKKSVGKLKKKKRVTRFDLKGHSGYYIEVRLSEAIGRNRSVRRHVQ